jgi:hypothetical protein
LRHAAPSSVPSAIRHFATSFQNESKKLKNERRDAIEGTIMDTKGAILSMDEESKR